MNLFAASTYQGISLKVSPCQIFGKKEGRGTFSKIFLSRIPFNKNIIRRFGSDLEGRVSLRRGVSLVISPYSRGFFTQTLFFTTLKFFLRYGLEDDYSVPKRESYKTPNHDIYTTRESKNDKQPKYRKRMSYTKHSSQVLGDHKQYPKQPKGDMFRSTSLDGSYQPVNHYNSKMEL